MRAAARQVPVQERERLLKKEGLDPTRLANLSLVYKVQEVPAHTRNPGSSIHFVQEAPAAHI